MRHLYSRLLVTMADTSSASSVVIQHRDRTIPTTSPLLTSDSSTSPFCSGTLTASSIFRHLDHYFSKERGVVFDGSLGIDT